MYRVLVFFAAITLALSGVLLFSSGFLLQRRVTERHSTCADVKDTFYKSTGVELGLNAPVCWYPPRFQKAIILLIDALQYEFAVHGPPWTDVEHFRNKMPIFTELISQNRSNAILLKSLADAPTTTLQRLKGLMTGSLPTFIDAGTNFYQTRIHEDSVVEQLYRKGKRVVFMGDDTWMQLFPNSFVREHGYPSFYVKDLDTVDSAVLEHLYSELGQPGEWDVLIAHFLGVDHCGHWLGKNHPRMADKLQQMNQMIRNVTSLLEPEILLVVLSDHGMTSDGDHGGDTQDEVESTLFLYSLSPFLQPGTAPRDDTAPVEQLDFAATFSLLVGIPIPFSSLGTRMDFAFPAIQNAKDALPLWINVQQVARYLTEMKTLGDPEQELKWLQQLWDACIAGDKGGVDRFASAANKFLSTAHIMARRAWAFFDLRLMTSGLVATCCALMLMLIAAGSSPRRIMQEMWMGTATCATFWVLAPFSNSYLINGDKVTLYLLQTLLILSVLRRWRHLGLRSLSAMAVVLLTVRMGAFFWRCREDHAGACDPDPLMAPLDQSGTEGVWRALMGIASVLAVASWCSTGQVVTRRGKPSLPGPLWGPLQTALVGAAVIMSAYWLTQLRPIDVVERLLGSNQESLVKVAELLCGTVWGIILLFPTLVQKKAWRLSFLMATGTLGVAISAYVGASYVPSLAALSAAAAAHFMLLRDHEGVSPPWWHLCLCWVLWGQMGFYSAGHQATFASLHWRAALVGISGSPSMVGGAVRTLANTFSGPLLTAWSVAPLSALHHHSRGMPSHVLRDRAFQLLARYWFFLLAQLCSSMAACFLHRRHLMVWAIFAPHYVFQGASAAVSLVGTLMGTVVFLRLIYALQGC